MKNYFLISFCILLLSSQFSHSQVKTRTIQDGKFIDIQQADSLSNKETIIKLSGKTVYTDYKIISFKKDTTYIDTTLSILKEYRHNFLRKDNFELLAFHNIGQTFNSLAYNFVPSSLIPSIGMKAKHFNYLNTQDINYYEVPTPTTEISYKSGLEQGQVLESLFTLNFSRRLNVGISYRGIRSLGKYRSSLSSHGNFNTVFSYNTKNERYFLKGHLSSQDLLNDENGGLTEASLTAFIDDDPNFATRGRLDVNLVGTESKLEGERIYIEHEYKLFSSKDSVQQQFSNLKIGHSFTNEFKFYQFNQTTQNNTVFGSNSTNSDLSETVENRYITNQFFLEFNSKYVLGKFKVNADLINYNYGYDTILNSNTTVITNPKLRGSAVSIGADWKAQIKNFQLNTKVTVNPGDGYLSGNDFYSEAIYKKDSAYSIKGSIAMNSKSPNFNTLLFQSSYDDYNWENPTFKNINTKNLHVGVDTKWLTITGDYTNIENYTYFDSNSKPQQAADNITYLKIKASNEFTFGKFALNNTVLFQKVDDGNNVLNVPDFITRNTFYYTDYLFKGKPLFLQTGITFKYFSTFNANAFNPLLNEFVLQDTTEIGYPTIDVFINAQIRRTRIYFKIENATSGFSKKNYFSAPNYPYRDFVIRFGLVWNWFI